MFKYILGRSATETTGEGMNIFNRICLFDFMFLFFQRNDYLKTSTDEFSIGGGL